MQDLACLKCVRKRKRKEKKEEGKEGRQTDRQTDRKKEKVENEHYLQNFYKGAEIMLEKDAKGTFLELCLHSKATNRKTATVSKDVLFILYIR